MTGLAKEVVRGEFGETTMVVAELVWKAALCAAEAMAMKAKAMMLHRTHISKLKPN